MVRYTVEKNESDFIAVDQCGKHTPHNKTTVAETGELIVVRVAVKVNGTSY